MAAAMLGFVRAVEAEDLAALYPDVGCKSIYAMVAFIPFPKYASTKACCFKVRIPLSFAFTFDFFAFGFFAFGVGGVSCFWSDIILFRLYLNWCNVHK